MKELENLFESFPETETRRFLLVMLFNSDLY
jgi:hypothetical protein